MTGRVHSLQSLGTLDGPGVRFVVFLQGCPLRCVYCHNPDTWEASGGMQMTPDAVFEKILRCKRYFGMDGGVTVSGGEALVQADFAHALFQLCKANGIHTCLDTSGCIWNEDVSRLLTATDLVLLDIKFTDEAAYRACSGGSLAQTLAFLERLAQREIPVWIRHVVVPGLTDSEENIRRLRELVKPFPNVERVELLPFRKLCIEKYNALGLAFALKDVPEMEQTRLNALECLLAGDGGEV